MILRKEGITANTRAGQIMQKIQRGDRNNPGGALYEASEFEDIKYAGDVLCALVKIGLLDKIKDHNKNTQYFLTRKGKAFKIKHINKNCFEIFIDKVISFFEKL